MEVSGGIWPFGVVDMLCTKPPGSRSGTAANEGGGGLRVQWREGTCSRAVSEVQGDRTL